MAQERIWSSSRRAWVEAQARVPRPSSPNAPNKQVLFSVHGTRAYCLLYFVIAFLFLSQHLNIFVPVWCIIFIYHSVFFFHGYCCAGALTVGVVTKPFGFEGRKRFQQAQQAILNLKDRVDTLIVVSNDKLLQIVPENTPLTDAFLVADDILRQGVVGISEIIIKPGLVNVDFADVRSIMGNAGT